MADLNYKIVGNLSHVRMPGGMQLSVAYLLIDQHPEVNRAEVFGDIRQVRGYNWAGNHVFTVWIKHGDELEWEPCESNMRMLSHDGTMKDIGPTGLLKIGEFRCALVKSDGGKPFFVEDYACQTNAPEPILDKLVRFYLAPAIPITVHVRKEERGSVLREMGLVRG
jgi:hypothetical protein